MSVAANSNRRTALVTWNPHELSQKLETFSAQIADVLPEVQRTKADWFMKRAMLEATTGNQAAKLRKCSGDSIITAIIKGAELGIPIDGKLGYFVPFWNKHKGCNEAKFMPSYLGLLMVAKRSGQIADGFPGMVHANDHFIHGRKGDQCTLEHTWKLGQPRGEPLAAYCVVKFPDGSWTYELMEMDELAAIRTRSQAANDGPWVTDTDQMNIKTVVRRACKRYCSDPGFIKAVQLDEEEFDQQAHKRVTRANLNDILPGIEHAEEEELPEFDDDHEPMPKVDELQAIKEKIEIAKAVGDIAELNRLDELYCGPDSELDATPMSTVAAWLKAAKESLSTRKTKGKSENLFPTNANAGQ